MGGQPRDKRVMRGGDCFVGLVGKMHKSSAELGERSRIRRSHEMDEQLVHKFWGEDAAAFS